jgi:hypothetical protein
MPKKFYLLFIVGILLAGYYFVYKDHIALESASKVFGIKTTEFSANTYDNNISSKLIEEEYFNSIKRLKKNRIEFRTYYYEDELTFPNYVIVCEFNNQSSVLIVGYANDNSYFYTKSLTGKWSPPLRSINYKQLYNTPQSLSFPQHGI